MLPSVVLQEPGKVGHRKSTKMSSVSASTPCIGSTIWTTSKSNDGWTTMLSPSHVRKKLRVNAVNKANLNKIWGDSFARMVKIQKVIDDYNNWMGGIDQNDQLIANYRHQLHCKRISMPLMFHSFGCAPCQCIPGTL